MCTQTLGDLGADVIKLERPPYGDVARTTMPMIDGESGYFFSINRGKRSIAVDLTTESGKSIFQDLVKEVDVVVENFTPGAMSRLGLGYADLKDLNPGLIYAAISGYGQTGPLRISRPST
jgi:CoA:oxalate CoA-transferase